MSFNVASVLSDARYTLQDTAGVRWSDTELKRYLLIAQIKIAHALPGKGPTEYLTAALATGIEQRIAENGSARAVSHVLDLPYNMVSTTPGQVIRRITKDQLDAQRPRWATEEASATTLYWMPHQDDPTRFYVYPSATSAARARALVALVPNNVDSIEVTDACFDACRCYVIAQAWAKDSTYAKGSLEHMESFRAEIAALSGIQSDAAKRVTQRETPR